MGSVTKRISEIKQPRGGYLPLKSFEETVLDDGKTILEGESLSHGLMGIAVDYLSRFLMGTDKDEAFSISLKGARLIGEQNYSRDLLSKNKGLDDISIISAVRLAGYDVVLRAGKRPQKDVRDIEISDADIDNICVMVERTLAFWQTYGPIVDSGMTFEGGGYSDTVSSGDADYMTSDTLWDLKTSSKKPMSKDTLQILMYYIMGLHSVHREAYSRIQFVGFYNPRLNVMLRCRVQDIPQDIIKIVEDEVICYGKSAAVSADDIVPDLSVPREPEVSDDSEELTVKDVAIRYGISENKVRTDCFIAGMPHVKKGNKYIINSKDLFEWEIEKAYIKIGRSGGMLLPGYRAYVKTVEEELAAAKRNKDKERVKALKDELERLDSKVGYTRGVGKLLLLAVALLALFFVLYFLLIDGFPF